MCITLKLCVDRNKLWQQRILCWWSLTMSMLHLHNNSTFSFLTGFLCVMSLLFCQHGCSLCHAATAEATVWARFWRRQCHDGTKGIHHNTQHTGLECLTVLQNTENNQWPSRSGIGDILTEASIGAQLAVSQWHYSVKTQCQWAILCSCCCNYFSLNNEMTQLTAVWTSSVSSLTASRSILI
jgi:hypothetical protein